ncbi:helix-turn-helix domain-containing protein [Deinococcus hopiensis]|uniref:helix-turn-helix domain-containing protein n=1 Tax=Deinococcus hopiensis TaxID=309885 RepID=UPI0009FC3561
MARYIASPLPPSKTPQAACNGRPWRSIHIQEHFGIALTEVCVWGYLERLGFTAQVPRPTHTEAASPKEQGTFIKKSRRR